LSGRLGYFVTLIPTLPIISPPFLAQYLSWDLSGRLGYFVTYDLILRVEKQKRKMSWDLSGRLGYFVTIYFANSSQLEFSVQRWDLSGRLGYFVTKEALPDIICQPVGI